MLAIRIILLRLPKGTSFWSNFWTSFPVRIQKYKNEGVCRSESTNLNSLHCPKDFQKLEKIREIARRASVMKYIFNNIAGMQYLW